MEGFLLIDKPDGMTSHDVVDRVRKYTGIRKVGHAGTLDPFATGLLVVGVGRPATKQMQTLSGLDKKYEAVFMLGGSSDTDDRTGRIVSVDVPELTDEGIVQTLKTFEGPIEQIPPAYSAIKIGGKKMYEAAREGKPLEAKPRSITIHTIEMTGPLAENQFPVHIHCSTGTYIRSIARDTGKELGTAGYVEELRRTSIGPYSIEHATPLDDLEGIVESKLIPVDDFLAQL
jgi:tRNA pseudouridine55 synthase